MRGSVWEFKIDPKRFREEIKNDIDGPRTLPSSKMLMFLCEYEHFREISFFDRIIVLQSFWGSPGLLLGVLGLLWGALRGL